MERAMNRRVGALLGVSWLTLALGAGPVFAAGAPSEQEIYRALRPAPQGLGPHQGIPTLGTIPAPTESPNVHGVSTKSGGAPAVPSKPKVRAAAAAPRPEDQASAEAHPAITFNTIQFAFGSAQITPESSETLRKLGNVLNHELADQKAFLVEGHTDARGSTRANAVLSRHRAEAVKDYLVRELSVSPSRLQVVGKGFSEPANRADPYASENRRVIVVNLGA
jgi:outer membrane protein OmpA-like peptidoglycan-associated protein